MHPITLKHMMTVAPPETHDQHSAADPAISTLMTTQIIAVLPGTRLIDALRVMNAAGVHHLPIVEGNHCVGLLAEIDMLRQLVTQTLLQPRCAMRLTARQVCRQPAPMVPVWSTRAVAAQMMLATGSDAVIVSDNERLLGIVTASDIAASLVGSTSQN
jgi:predicted transcriptional regulator